MLNNLAAPRMAAVQNFFIATSQTDLLGCYAWSQAVSAALLPLLADLEVTLRNALHISLSQYYGGSDSFNWMMTTPPLQQGNHGKKPKPAAHRMNPKSQENIVTAVRKLTRKRPLPTPDDIVAALPFGFWEQIINSLDHKSQPSDLQDTILASVFPHAPDLHRHPHGSPGFKLRVVNLLARIRDVRNRISHHDAIWKTPEFDPHGTTGFIPRSPRHTVNSLRLLAQRIAWLAGWVDPAITHHMQQSDYWWSYHALLDRDALTIFRITGGAMGSFEQVLNAKSVTHRFGRQRRLYPRMRHTKAEQLRMRLKGAQFHY